MVWINKIDLISFLVGNKRKMKIKFKPVTKTIGLVDYELHSLRIQIRILYW